jgi:hypothetical protein
MDFFCFWGNEKAAGAAAFRYWIQAKKVLILTLATAQHLRM